MLYDIEVRPGPNTGFFQYYTETVEANTSHDAIARVQRANPGCQVRCCRSYNKPNESNGFSSSSGEDTSGYLILGAILFCIWFLVEYWWIVVPVLVIIGLLVWYGNEN
jgi:hypothetical protein